MALVAGIPAALVPAGTSALRILGTSAVRLLVNATSTAIPPIYSALLTGTLTTVAPAADLFILFTGAAFHTGAAINVAINFRIRVNGVLIAPGGGTTINALVSQIQSASYSARVPVVAGLQTVVVEWGGFGLAANTLNILALTLPDLCHASLLLEEHAP